MFIMLIIYFLINFDIAVLNYNDNGLLELGSKTSVLVEMSSLERPMLEHSSYGE